VRVTATDTGLLDAPDADIWMLPVFGPALKPAGETDIVRVAGAVPELGETLIQEALGVAGSQTLSPASAVLAGIVLAAFGFFTFGELRGVVPPGQHSGSLGIRGPAAPATALAIAGAMMLVAFGLMIVRRDVASQAIGFFSLENAISLAALVVAAGLPLILETAFLFDLLVAVVVFGMLIRGQHARSESLSTADLTRLRG